MKSGFMWSQSRIRIGEDLQMMGDKVLRPDIKIALIWKRRISSTIVFMINMTA